MRSRQIWHALPGVHYYMPAGGCRGICSRPHGRCKPLCHPYKTVYNYVQGHSVSPLHLGRASTVLRSSPEICFRMSVGCRLCRVCFDQYWGWQVIVGYTVELCRVLSFFYVNSVLFCFSTKPRQDEVRFFSFTFFCPAQVSWSNVFSFESLFFPPDQVEPVWWFLFFFWLPFL